MTPAQQSALEGVAGRPLTAPEIEQIDPLLDPNNRNDTAIAAILSAGRTRPVPTEIGVGTVLATLGEGAGEWLDTITAVGAANRDVFWALKLLDRGVLRIDLEATRAQMQALAGSVAQLSDGINALLTLGSEPDPLPVADVSRALNIAEGRANL